MKRPLKTTLWKAGMLLLFAVAAVLFCLAYIKELEPVNRAGCRYAAFGLLILLAGILLLREQGDKRRREGYLKQMLQGNLLTEQNGEKWQEGLSIHLEEGGILLVSGQGELIRPLPARGIRWVVLGCGITGLAQGTVPETAEEVFIPADTIHIEEGALGLRTIIRTEEGTAAADYGKSHGMMLQTVKKE